MIGDDRKMRETSDEELALVIAQETAKSSNSITAYLDSVSERNLEPAWTTVQFSPLCCCTVPSAKTVELSIFHSLAHFLAVL